MSVHNKNLCCEFWSALKRPPTLGKKRPPSIRCLHVFLLYVFFFFNNPFKCNTSFLVSPPPPQPENATAQLNERCHKSKCHYLAGRSDFINAPCHPPTWLLINLRQLGGKDTALLLLAATREKLMWRVLIATVEDRPPSLLFQYSSPDKPKGAGALTALLQTLSCAAPEIICVTESTTSCCQQMHRERR